MSKSYMAAWMLAKDTGIDKRIIEEIWIACKLPITVFAGEEAPVRAELERRGLLAPKVAAPAQPKRRGPKVARRDGLSGIKGTRGYSLDCDVIRYIMDHSEGNASAYIEDLVIERMRADGTLPAPDDGESTATPERPLNT